MLTLVHPFATSWPSSPKGDARTLRDLLSVSYGMISILVISRCAAPPYPAAPDFHLKVKRLTMICASLALLQNVFAVHRRAIPQPSARRAVKLKNPPAVRPVHPKNPFPQPFYTTCRHQAATTLGPKVRQPSHRRCVPRGVFSALDCLTFCVIINTSNKLNI